MSEGIGRKRVLDSAAGSNQNALTMMKLRKVPIFFPSSEEQKKISDFYKILQNAIALHQRKLDKLELMKKGLLKLSFPAKGVKIPFLRFTNFHDHWEQRKLKDITEITMGQSPKGENYTDNPNDYILVQGNADIKDGWVSPRVWTTQVTKTADKGDIIFSVRAPVGDIGRTKYNVVIGRGVAGIKGNEFVFQSLSKMKSNGFWAKYSTGSTFESINSSDLKEAIIFAPSKLEQKKIGTFLNKIDNTIALHHQKLDKLNEIKKAYLQKMFI